MFKVPRGDDPEKYNWLADELTLIDFGEAQYFIPRKGRELTPKKLNTTYLLPLALSPWELQGSMAGPRDDFFRLFERISEVLSNGARGNRKAMMSHHLATDNLFLDPTWKAGRLAKAGRKSFHGEEFCYNMGLTRENRTMLQSHFQLALDAIFGCCSRDDLPGDGTIKSDPQYA